MTAFESDILPVIRRIAILLLAAILASMMWLQALAQEEQAPTLSSQTQNKDTISNRIRELETSTEVDEALKNRLLELYRTALSRLESAEIFKKNAENFRADIETAPIETKRIRQKMVDNPSASPSEITIDVPPEANSKELEPLLAKEQAVLAGLKSRLTELVGQIKAEQDRPEKIRSQMAVSRQKLEEIESELKLASPKEEDSRVTEARIASLEARKFYRATELAAFEQELLSHECRMNLLQAMRDQVAAQSPGAEARVQAIQEIMNARRLDEAKQTKEEAKQAEQAAQRKHPIIRSLATENAGLSQELESCVKDIADASEKHQNIIEQFENSKSAHETTQQQIKKIGLRGALGKVLLSELRQLPNLRTFQTNAVKRRELISTINFRIFEIAEDRGELEDLDGKIDELLSKDLETTLASEQLGLIKSEVRSHLESKQAILQSLEDSYLDYVKKLGAIDFDEKLLFDEVRAYTGFLEERLLWIPNSLPVDLDIFGQIGAAVLWFASPLRWIEAGEVWCGAALDRAVTTTGAAIFLFLLLFYRFRLRKIINVDATRVGKVHTDRFFLTIKALVITVLLSLPWPFLIGFSGWILTASYEAPEFAKAVGEGLGAVAWLFLTVQFFRVLCSPGGVASVHLRWAERTCSLLRRNLFWLMTIVIPAQFVITAIEWQETEAYKASLGRVAFIVEMLVLGLFTIRLLKPRGGVLEHFLARNPNGWISKLRYVWYSIAVCVPIALIFISAAGYHYTALRLENRLFATIALTVAAVIVNSAIMRWLFITHGKLALAKARERLDAARTSTADSGGTAETTSGTVSVDIPEFDLGRISQQTRDFLRAVLSLAVVVGIWLIWADVLPALNILRGVELWHHTMVTDGEPRLIPVTLADLVLVLLVVILTSMAARNLPGVLEIAVLQHLPLERGTRYAITTISRYLIITVGIVIALSTIGLTWSSIQWVVAALGVGLGFGLHEIFNNFISGLIILFERPIRVGDTVTVGGIVGTVSRIRIRATTITDWDLKELVVPNKTFITEQLVNWTLSDPVMRLIVKVGIAYGSDTEKALRVAHQTAVSIKYVLEDPPPQVLFLGFGESSLDFEVRVFVKGTNNYVETRHELHMAIDKAFRKHGIEIAFPQRDLHLRSVKAPLRVEKTKFSESESNESDDFLASRVDGINVSKSSDGGNKIEGDTGD